MKFKKTTAVILSLVFLTGCKSASTEKNKVEDEFKGKITVWAGNENIEALRRSSENYKKIHANVIIDLVETEKFDLESKENLPDIICAEDEEVQGLITKFLKNLENTSSFVKKENYLKYKIENLSFQNNLYGIPFNSKPALIVYRTDILQAANLKPEYIKTWVDFIEAGKVLKNNNKQMTAMSLENEKTYRAFLNQLGGSYYDNDKKLILNSHNTIKAVEILKRIYSSGIAANINSNADAINLLVEGKVASAIMMPDEVKLLLEKNSQLNEKLKISKLPAFEEGGNQSMSLGGSNLLLLSSSENKKTAVDFAKFTAENRENTALLLKELGIFPAYTYYYDEIWFRKEALSIYSEVAKNTYSINYTESFSKILKPSKDAFSSIVIKDQDIKITLDDLQKNLSILNE